MRLRQSTGVLLLTLLLLSGCGKKEEQSTAKAQTYHFVGQVIAIDAPASQITIAHSDMPGFMEAMTMPFVVRDTNLFAGISVGDSVRGVLVVQRPEVWLDSLKLISKM